MLTKESLKQEALLLFKENGYEGTSIAQLVKKVGISKSSFYAHFESKEALFMAVYEEAAEGEASRVNHAEEANRNAPAVEQIEAVFMALTDPVYADDSTQFLHRMLFYPPAGLKERMQETFNAMELRSSESILKMLTSCVGGKDVLPYLHSFYALVDGLAIEAHLYNEKEHAERRERIWSFYRSTLQQKGTN